ncbi:MAG: preprotein translocase subunit YajC [Deltaproteobacteria bacterium]|nr:preprotein translocase subunit YajC [Deltaproteobacteria bacterium]
MFLSDIAYAMGTTGDASAQGGNPLTAFMPLIIMFAIFYFLLIRPQQKKAKEHRQTLANLNKGDHILTNGGLYGRITAIAEDVLTVDLGEENLVRINRGYIAGLAEPKAGNGGTAAAERKKKDKK